MYLSKLKLNPNNTQVQRDVGKPYQLHATLARGFGDDEVRVLWRLEIPSPLESPIVLVQSHTSPDWTEVEAKFDSYFEEKKVQTYQFLDSLKEGDSLRFLLKANPSAKREKKRHAILDPLKQIEWIKRKGKAGGFDLLACQLMGEERQHIYKHDDDEPATITILSVTFTGILKITKLDSFLDIIKNGVGPAKGFGHGLLSIAPVRTHSVQ